MITYSLSNCRSGSDRLHFLYWGVFRLLLGVAQIVMAAWCLALFISHGINARTMRVAFLGAGITTLSLLLFKVAKLRS